MKRNDWILAAGVIVAAVLIFCVQLVTNLSFDEEQAVVLVTVKGGDFGSYRLSEDQTVDIGGKNTLVIKDGTARMEKADCPDQICVHHREISRNGESIICLPNQVVVSVKSSEESELDGVAR